MTQRLYIMDLDGTLVDTLQDITQAVNRVLETMRLSSLPPQTIHNYIGQGARWLLSMCLKAAGETDPSRLTEARSLFLPTYRDGIADHSQPFPHVLETLEELKQTGAHLTVCTNKPIELAEILMDKLALRPFFTTVLGGDSLPTKKPAPEPLLQIMKDYNVGPAHTLMVGDRIYDIQAGRNAKTWTCGMAYREEDKAPLQAERAHRILTKFSDLPSVFASLLQGEGLPRIDEPTGET